MAERKAIRLGSVVRTNVSTYSEKEGWAFVNYLDTGNITQDTISEIQRINVGTDKLPSRARRKVQSETSYIRQLGRISSTMGY